MQNILALVAVEPHKWRAVAIHLRHAGEQVECPAQGLQ